MVKTDIGNALAPFLFDLFTNAKHWIADLFSGFLIIYNLHRNSKNDLKSVLRTM